MSLTVKIVSLGSDEYNSALDLREKILRAPQGMQITPEDLESDKNAIHFVALGGNEVIGTGQLLEADKDTARVKQMAVKPDLQQSGVGRLIMISIENHARQLGYKKSTLSARELVLGFYNSLGYAAISERFFIHGIPHFEMSKDL